MHKGLQAPRRYRVSLLRLALLLALAYCGSSLAEGQSAVKHGPAWEIVTNECKSCHGLDGRAASDSWPNLNCQNRGYLYSRLLHLREGNDHHIDNSVTKLTVQQISAIADYYASQPCKKRQ